MGKVFHQCVKLYGLLDYYAITLIWITTIIILLIRPGSLQLHGQGFSPVCKTIWFIRLLRYYFDMDHNYNNFIDKARFSPGFSPVCKTILFIRYGIYKKNIRSILVTIQFLVI